MTIENRIELIEEAQELLRQAIYNIQTAVQGSTDSEYEQTYIIRSLRNMIDGGDDSYDTNLDSIIKSIIGDEKIIQDS